MKRNSTNRQVSIEELANDVEEEAGLLLVGVQQQQQQQQDWEQGPTLHKKARFLLEATSDQNGKSGSHPPCSMSALSTSPFNKDNDTLRRYISEESTDKLPVAAEAAAEEEEEPQNNDKTTRTKMKPTQPNTTTGSLDSLVAKKFGGNFGTFFDQLLEEMQSATFSFSGFTRTHGVPKARETLRNLACYLQGQATNQFLAETWKKRVREYQTARRGGSAAGCDDASSSSNNPGSCRSGHACGAAVTIDKHDISPPPRRRTSTRTTDISHGQKRAKRRGREGALDAFVRTRFEGNFFWFLDVVHQEMQHKDFTPTAFVRQHDVPGGRETLRHIVSHLKQEYTSSDRLLAQMWKDRIRVYQESRKSGKTQAQTISKEDDPVPESNLPRASSICSV